MTHKKPRLASSPASRLTLLLANTIDTIADRKPTASVEDFCLTPVNPVRILVAYSGGKDSTALVDVLARLKKTAYKNVIESVTAVHVHHGLSKMADDWVRHAEEQCG